MYCKRQFHPLTSDVAVNWGYVNHRPFADLILSECEPADVEPYSPEEVMTIVRTATEPFKTFLWILGEGGMRPAEVCALDAQFIHLHERVISVCQAESLGLILKPKTVAGWRDFAISPQLAEHLRNFLGNKTEGLLFVSRTGRPWRESKVTEKRLNPLLRKLGIKQKGLNGYRHFNATEMDKNNVPIKTRQTRLGHDDPRMTLGMRNESGYTHMVGEDDRRVAAMFGDMFSQVLRLQPCRRICDDGVLAVSSSTLAFLANDQMTIAVAAQDDRSNFRESIPTGPGTRSMSRLRGVPCDLPKLRASRAQNCAIESSVSQPVARVISIDYFFQKTGHPK
jgi:hypothetical protein